MKNILLVWDVDGTLIDSKGCGRRAMDKAFYEVFGIANGFHGVDMAGRLDAMIVKDAMDNHCISQRNYAQFFDRYCKMLEQELKEQPVTKLLGGIREILDYSDEEIRIYHALGTGNIEKGARLKLRPHEINHYFPTGGFGDEPLERWEIIQQAIHRMEAHLQIGFKKEDTYVIGDTPFDIACGESIGIKSIGVATGAHSYETLEGCKPDHLFKNLEDTKGFIRILK